MESPDCTVTSHIGGVWDSSTSGSYFPDIDEGVTTPNDNTDNIGSLLTSTHGAVLRMGTTNPPADTDTITGLKFRLRGQWQFDEATPPGPYGFYVSFYTGGILIGSNEVHVILSDLGDSFIWLTTAWLDVPGTFSKTKAQGNAMEVRIRSDPNSLAEFSGSTSDAVYITAFDFRYVYTPVVATNTTANHKMSIGVGPALRR